MGSLSRENKWEGSEKKGINERNSSVYLFFPSALVSFNGVQTNAQRRSNRGNDVSI